MARCSGVCPKAPSAFITSASVFHSFVFSSSLKSWSTVVGLVPSKRTKTLSFFFMLGHSERSEAESRLQRSPESFRGEARLSIPREHFKVLQGDASTSLDMTGLVTSYA